MHYIFGLIDPRNMRIFHVGCATTPTTEPKSLPAPVASRVREMQPTIPQIVILQTVNAHPQVEWVKWSKRFRRDILTSDWKQYTVIANAFTNSTRANRVLGEDGSSYAAQAKFHEFDRQNPDVFEDMLRRARALRAEGRTISGVDVLVNDIRYDGVDTNRTDPFKISNNHRAFYARKLQMVEPSLCGLFLMRESMADDLVLEDGRTWREFATEHADLIRFAGPEGAEEEDMRWTY